MVKSKVNAIFSSPLSTQIQNFKSDTCFYLLSPLPTLNTAPAQPHYCPCRVSLENASHAQHSSTFSTRPAPLPPLVQHFSASHFHCHYLYQQSSISTNSSLSLPTVLRANFPPFLFSISLIFFLDFPHQFICLPLDLFALDSSHPISMAKLLSHCFTFFLSFSPSLFLCTVNYRLFVT